MNVILAAATHNLRLLRALLAWLLALLLSFGAPGARLSRNWAVPGDLLK